MPHYYIKFSGCIWNFEADDKKDVEKKLEDMPLDVFASFQILEIGKDVDDKGYPLPIK